ncbi:MAG: MFS transporter [Proteobacteria bacterium]|nr:MAG: MFS transporter [Pseudomonadota bacterium]
MLLVLKSAWALMIGVLLLMIGNGLQGTLLGVRGSLEGVDSAALGFVMSAYFAGFLGGSKLTPILLRRVGHVRVFAAFGSLISAAFILYAVRVDPLYWVVLRLLVGFCFSGLYVVAESWINDTATNETRGQALSLYTIMQMGGIVLGQLFLNLSDPVGYGLFVLISVLVSLSIAPILLSVSPAPVHHSARPMSLRELLAVSPLGCVGIFLMGGVFSALFGMASVYAAKRGLSIAEISWFLTAIYMGGLLFQYPIGWLSDRVDRRHLIFGITFFCSLAAIAAMLTEGSSFFVLLLLAFLVGGTANPLYPLLIAYTNDHLQNEQMSSASGGLLFLNGIGAMGGPIIVGYMVDHMGSSGFFLFIAILTGLIAAYSVYRMTQSDSIAVEDTNPYVPLYGTATQVAAEIAFESDDTAETRDSKAEDTAK